MNALANPLHPSAQIRLPAPLALPLRLIPNRLHSRVLATLLNRVLAEYLASGELAMLEGRTLSVEVRDAGLRYDLTNVGGRISASSNPADVCLSGHVQDFLLLLTRREDPDTLFFQRRLAIQGDTGLGLHVKNFLDSIDWDGLPLPGVARQGLERTLDLYQRVLG
jgi:O2-independent ubiquinone biosynthesis accessory factor UbiT